MEDLLSNVERIDRSLTDLRLGLHSLLLDQETVVQKHMRLRKGGTAGSVAGFGGAVVLMLATGVGALFVIGSAVVGGIGTVVTVNAGMDDFNQTKELDRLARRHVEIFKNSYSRRTEIFDKIRKESPNLDLCFG